MLPRRIMDLFGSDHGRIVIVHGSDHQPHSICAIS